MARFARTACATLAVCIVAVVWILGGPPALAYALLFVLVTIPGLPLGFALFDRRHVGGWVAGMALGYALTALAWWAVVFFHVVSTPAFIGAWAIGIGGSSVLAALLTRRQAKTPLVTLPAWTRTDTVGIALVLLLVPALVCPPFARLGSWDAAGNRLYRAYFISDFVWHTALTAELTKHTQPPRNPYLASEPMHYYWTYFLVPATISGQTGIDVQDALKLNAFGAALLFVAAIYLAAWVSLPVHPMAVAVGVALTIVATSAEGLAASAELLRRGQSLEELRNLNIDAIAAWAFKGLRIDDLPRSMWYNPQHSTACALGLIAIPVAICGGLRARPAAIGLAGLALGASVAFNPFVGAVFSIVYGATMLIEAVRTRGRARDILRHAIAAVPVFAALGWCVLNQVADTALGALQFGFSGPARNAPLLTFLLSFGPILIPVAIGIWPVRKTSFATAWPALSGVVISVLLMFFFTLTADVFWVGFRAGQIFFVLVPALVARGFARLWRPGFERAAVAIAAIVLIGGLPTTVIDAYNAQDVTNLAMGPGDQFHWTVRITPDEQEALAWIKTHTRRDAIVQAEPIVRGRETWSLIPTFAERRMAVGNGLPLIVREGYGPKSERVREIYATSDPKSAWKEAKDLGIDYLYADATERNAYPNVAKFDRNPGYFTQVFRNAEAAVYAVR